jgi:hypothetical protein
MGSPHSIHGHVVPGPEYGLGLTPSIVSFNDFGHNEYTFQASGMDDFFEINPAKPNPNGFVGECKTISRSVPCQHGSIPSNSESLSLSTFITSPNTMDTPTPMRSDSASRSMASPITPASSSLLLFLLFQHLLHLRVDLRKLLAPLSTLRRALLAGPKTCDYLLTLQSRNLSLPNSLRRTQHIINLLSFLNLVATLFRLSNHLVGFLCQPSIVFSRPNLLGITG